MKSIPILLTTAVLLAVTTALPAADPTWWAARGVTTGGPQSNLSPATIGQAKHMVAMALAELQSRLAPADYTALQADVAAIVDLTVPTNPTDKEKLRAVLLVGQLKAISKPFYTRLRVLDSLWVNNQMHQSSIRVVEPGSNPLSYSPYPWSVLTDDDSNYSPATVGQLKATFSLRFENWGIAEPADPPLPEGPDDTDSDGLSDVTEMAMGTSPTLSDSDGDGHLDSADAFPIDPSRWLALANVPGDHTPPQILLDSPATATYVAGP